MKLPPRLEIRTLFYLIFCLAILFTLILSDPDLFFHLKAGEDILHNRAIPAFDPYSFTHQGQPWRPHEWLFELFIYLLFTYGGYLGVKLFVATTALGALLLSANALSQQRNSELPLILFCALLLAPFISPRPHLFTLLFFALYLFALLRFKYRAERRHLWLLPPLMVLWVNMHGGFLLGIVIILTFLGGELLTALWQQRVRASWPQLRPLAWLLLWVSLASLLNPWGIQQWLFPLELMTQIGEVGISEWRPLNVAELHARAYLALVGLLFLLYLYSPRRPDTTEVVVPWGIIAASLFSVRHMALALLAMLPFMLLMQQQLVASSAWQTQPWVVAVRRYREHGKELGSREYLFNASLLAVVITLLALLYPYYHRNDLKRLNEMVPAAASDFIIAAQLQGRMFNTYRYGGYLIYRLSPQQQVFIDIRGDMYAKEIIDAYDTLYNAQPGWQAELERYAIDYLVIERHAPLASAALTNELFATAYRDEQSVVLVRNQARYRPYIEAWQSAHPDAAEADASSVP